MNEELYNFYILKKEKLSNKINKNSNNIYSLLTGFVLGGFEESASGPDGHLENLVESAAYTSGYFFLERISDKIFSNKISKSYFFGGMLMGQTFAQYVKKQIINN